ncbi:MAG: GAF domain-containing protein [Lachnospiraceae bacterium]|nr:GAF domain-containing protein [Lachnospiraceae bacterium]
MDITITEFHTKKEMYAQMARHIQNIFEETSDLYAALANTSALMALYLKDINWAGFYLLKNKELILGPFQGKPAVARIQIGDGVCGTAVRERAQQRVDDVHSCCNHIACDLNSSSEIVTPIFVQDQIFGVIDVDSPLPARFDEEDGEGMKLLAETFSGYVPIPPG